MKSAILVIFGLISCFSSALAQTEVRFTNRELNAAFVLARPELNQVEINGTRGLYQPAPALRFFGLSDQTFEINFNGIIELADIEFSHLKAKMPLIEFKSGMFVLTLPIEDQKQAVTSNLGTLSLKGVSLIAEIVWESSPNGVQNLKVQAVKMSGVMTGTGIVRPTFILNQVRALILKTLKREIAKNLNLPEVRDSVQKGLLSWAKFYTGTEFHSVVPGTVQFFTENTESGILFKVQ